MSVKLLTEHHLEFLSLKGGFTGSSESTLFKMPHCWKPHVAAHLCEIILNFDQCFRSKCHLIFALVTILISGTEMHHYIEGHT